MRTIDGARRGAWRATMGLACAALLGSELAWAAPDEGTNGDVTAVDSAAPAIGGSMGVPVPSAADATSTAPVPVPQPQGFGAIVTGPVNGNGFGTNGGVGGPATYPLPDPGTLPAAPTAPEDLPAVVDTEGPFAQQVACDPVDRPGVLAFAYLVTEHYGRPAFSTARPCIDYASFHHDGRGLDWPLDAGDPADRAVADSAIAWLTANDGEMAARLGIDYFVWDGLIWGFGNSRDWQVYTGTPHRDHIHFSFTWDGAQMRTSWWTGIAVSTPDLGPCDVLPGEYAAIPLAPRTRACDPTPVAVPASDEARVRPGESGAGASLVQDMLGLPVTGTLDEATREALLSWQLDQQIPATGVVDSFTYAAASGVPSPELPASALSVLPAEGVATEIDAYRRSELHLGDSGPAVEALQRSLRVDADGSFGPATAQALAKVEVEHPVLQAQAARRAEGDPLVTPLTWAVLEQQAHPTAVVRHVELALGNLDDDPTYDRGLGPEVAAATPAPAAGMVAEATQAGSSRDAGGAVALLQELLGLEVDGSFGPATDASVRAVQEDAGLDVTGRVDGATWVAVEEAAQAADED